MIKIIFMKCKRGVLNAVIDDDLRGLPSIMADGKTGDPISISHLLSLTHLTYLDPLPEQVAGFAIRNAVAIGRDLDITHLNFIKYAGVAEVGDAILDYCNSISLPVTDVCVWEKMAREAMIDHDVQMRTSWSILNTLKIKIEKEDSRG